MADALPIAVWSGSFKIGGLEMKCHLLEGGQRIIEAESLARFFDGQCTHSPTLSEMEELQHWLGAPLSQGEGA